MSMYVTCPDWLLNREFQDFFYHSLEVTGDRGTRVLLCMEPLIDASYLGMFDEHPTGGCEGATLSLAALAPPDRLISTYLHEYGHFLQQVDIDDGVSLSYTENGRYLSSLMNYTVYKDRYLDTMSAKICVPIHSALISTKKLEAILVNDAEMEWDASKRAYEILKEREGHMGVDLCKFAQEANTAYFSQMCICPVERAEASHEAWTVDSLRVLAPPTMGPYPPTLHPTVRAAILDECF